MNSTIYRYRPAGRLLGECQELERQTIYFASPDQSNDPMEGSNDVFWHGDAIVWRNLIRHYVLCLEVAVSLVCVSGPDFSPDLLDSVVRWSCSKLPTSQLRQQHKQTCSGLLAEIGLEDLLSSLASSDRKIRRDELRFYLSTLHPLALKHVLRQMAERGLLSTAATRFPELPYDKAIRQLITISEAVLTTRNSQLDVSALFGPSVRMQEQLTLIHLANEGRQLTLGLGLLCFEFPDFYCRRVTRMLHPSWYAACFVSDPTHAAMWAHYGDRHRGICLKFRTHRGASDTATLSLIGNSGSTWSEAAGMKKTKGAQRLPVRKVVYSNRFPEIDFFRSIGRLSIRALEAISNRISNAPFGGA